jgi:hypothetical protein
VIPFGCYQMWQVSSRGLRLGGATPALVIGSALGFVFAYPEYGYGPLFALALLACGFLAFLAVTLLTGFFRGTQPIAIIASWAALSLVIGFVGTIALMKVSFAVAWSSQARMEVPAEIERALATMDKETAAQFFLQTYRQAGGRARGRAEMIPMLQRFALDKEIKPQIRGEMLSLLVEALKDEDPDVRANAENALIGIGEPAAMHLRGAARGPDGARAEAVLSRMKRRATGAAFGVVALLGLAVAVFVKTRG